MKTTDVQNDMFSEAFSSMQKKADIIAKTQIRIITVPIGKIKTNDKNVYSFLSTKERAEVLAKDIDTNGQMDIPIVYPSATPGEYILIGGEKRLKANIELKKEKIDVRVIVGPKDGVDELRKIISSNLQANRTPEEQLRLAENIKDQVAKLVEYGELAPEKEEKLREEYICLALQIQKEQYSRIIKVSGAIPELKKLYLSKQIDIHKATSYSLYSEESQKKIVYFIENHDNNRLRKFLDSIKSIKKAFESETKKLNDKLRYQKSKRNLLTASEEIEGCEREIEEINLLMNKIEEEKSQMIENAYNRILSENTENQEESIKEKEQYVSKLYTAYERTSQKAIKNIAQIKKTYSKLDGVEKEKATEDIRTILKLINDIDSTIIKNFKMC